MTGRVDYLCEGWAGSQKVAGAPCKIYCRCNKTIKVYDSLLGQ